MSTGFHIIIDDFNYFYNFYYNFFLYIYIRAVKVNVLIYEIIVAEINEIKYLFTLFTSGVFPDTKPPRACSQSARRDRVEDGGSWGIVGRKVSIEEPKWRNNRQNKSCM